MLLKTHPSSGMTKVPMMQEQSSRLRSLLLIRQQSLSS